MKILGVLVIAVLLTGFAGCAFVGGDVADNYTPQPPAGETAYGGNIGRGLHTLEYVFLNTNSQLPPYETFGESFQRGLTTSFQTVDWALWDYDWGDPYQ
jgi:hypothetical protein